MSVYLPNGSTIAIAGMLAAEKLVSGISNASPAVATSEDHEYVAGDIVLLRSGWTSLQDRVARVSTPTADTFVLQGVSTEDLTRFPAGLGAGGARVVPADGWTPISQILETNKSGGDQQFYNYNFLEDTGDQRQIPTKRTPRQIQLQVADDPIMPHYEVLSAADADRKPRILRLTLSSGALIYYAAYISFDKVPTLTQDQAMALTVTLSLASEPTRYAS